MKFIEFEHSYQRSVAVVFTYIGILFGPLFVASGFEAQYSKNLVPGIALVVFSIYWLQKAIRSKNEIPKTDKLMFITIPMCLIPIGLLFAVAS